MAEHESIYPLQPLRWLGQGFRVQGRVPLIRRRCSQKQAPNCCRLRQSRVLYPQRYQRGRATDCSLRRVVSRGRRQDRQALPLVASRHQMGGRVHCRSSGYQHQDPLHLRADRWLRIPQCQYRRQLWTLALSSRCRVRRQIQRTHRR